MIMLNLFHSRFSLGAHIAGSAGRQYTQSSKRKAPSIIALDPAGPGFYNYTNNYAAINSPLNKDDAKTVHVIHTDTLHFGAPAKVGTVDFYPDGGFNQQGCPTYYSTAGTAPAFTPESKCAIT
jgi:phospholipase A1 protein A